MMLTQAIEQKTLARIVTDDFRAAEVFERYNLDFCCKGKRQLNDACQEKGILLSNVVSELEMLSDIRNNVQRFNEWSVEFLIDYIIQHHHSYCKTMVPLIQHHLQKVVSAHSIKFGEVTEIQSIFEKMSAEVISHICQEETLVFPLLKSVAHNKKSYGNECFSNQHSKRT
jgi:regulator of cell morphogenesis and NO signaling